MPAPRLRPLLVVLALALPLDLGCRREPETTVPDAQEDAVDGLTRNLLLALWQQDDARIAELAAPDLLASLDGPARNQLHEAFSWLGPIDTLTRISERALEGGVERRYAIEFENGEVELTVRTLNERVDSLQFEETMWAQIIERSAKAAIGDLRVAEFQFTTPDGKETLPAPTNPKAIHYSIAIEGLAIELREHWVSIHKEVFDAKGALVFKEKQDEELRFPEAEVGSTGGRINGIVGVPKKGSYELVLTITDKIAGDTIEHRQAFQIQ